MYKKIAVILLVYILGVIGHNQLKDISYIPKASASNISETEFNTLKSALDARGVNYNLSMSNITDTSFDVVLSVDLQIKLPDTPPKIINSVQDFALVKQMVDNEGRSHPNHTGWSANLYNYDNTYRSPTGSFWHNIGSHATDNSHAYRTYSGVELTNMVASTYGSVVAGHVLTSGTVFSPVSGSLNSVRLYSTNTLSMQSSPRNGDKAFMYYENDVYISGNVTRSLTITLDSPKCPDGSPKPANGNCSTGEGGGGTPPPPTSETTTVTEPKVCHSSAQGSYPNCTFRPFDLTDEIQKEVTPTWGTGNISWGLSKVTKSATGGSPTQIASTNLLPIGDGHYEARTPIYTQSGVLSGGQGKTANKTLTASDKGTQNYKVEYDYTNHYIETYKCLRPSEYTATQSVKTTTTTTTTTTNADGTTSTSTSTEESWEDYTVTAYDYSTCYVPVSDSSSYWQYVSERANWDKGEKYSCSQTLAIDHSFGATLTGTNSASGTWNIGRHADVRAYANSCSTTSSNLYTETLTHTSAHKDLNTQTYLPFVENPVVWQGNPNYDTTSVMPYMADTTSQGNMGVPEVDEVFKK
ncbi:MAG: hypothetical protein ABS882_05670 [Lysinibacillus sp.]